MTKPEKEILAEGKFVRLVRRGRWEWAERTNTSGAVVIVAITDDGKLLLVEQFREAMGCPVVELPAGLVGDEPDKRGEPILEAARRELLEETGYESDDWQTLTEGPSSAGLTDECYTVLLAKGARQVGPGGGDEVESIEVHAVELDQTEAWFDAKRAADIAVDPRVYAALYFAMKYC